jgi:cysteine desulfurase
MIALVIQHTHQSKKSEPLPDGLGPYGDILYFDNNASTRPEPNVIEAVARAMFLLPGNASGSHQPAREAHDAVERARVSCAGAVGATPQEVVFTSGATESNNLALFGLAGAAMRDGRDSGSRRRVLVGATEHPSVLASAASLRHTGITVTVIPVDSSGQHDLDFVEQAMDDDVLLVSVMLANNETGVVSSLVPIVNLAKAVGAVVHCDATQAVGRIPVAFDQLGVDLMALSGHKMHGPKGVGALIVRRGLPLSPHQRGGSQERALRAGTLNTPGIVGLGVAADAVPERLKGAARIAETRDYLVRCLIEAVPETELVGDHAERLPNTANLWFRGADAEAVLAGMPTVAASTGAACATGNPEPSHVLRAMGMGTQASSECVRFSLSGDTTLEEVTRLVELTRNAIEYVRQMTKDEP